MLGHKDGYLPFGSLAIHRLIEECVRIHMGDCQSYGRFLGTLNFRCRIRIGIQKGMITLTTTHRVHVPGPPRGIENTPGKPIYYR